MLNSLVGIFCLLAFCSGNPVIQVVAIVLAIGVILTSNNKTSTGGGYSSDYSEIYVTPRIEPSGIKHKGNDLDLLTKHLDKERYQREKEIRDSRR